MTETTGNDHHDAITSLRHNLKQREIDFSKPLDKNVITSGLRDKNFLVTGGASGMGELFIKAFSGIAAGTRVVIADKDAEKGEALAQDLESQGRKAKFIEVDVSSWDSQVSLFKHALEWFKESGGHQSIDHLICSAGVLSQLLDIAPVEPSSLLSENKPAEPPTKSIQTSLVGTIYTVQLAMKYAMGLHETGSDKSITLLGSQSGFTGLPGRTDYSASKWGVRGVFKTLIAEVSGENPGVRINHFAPFFVPTPLLIPRMAEFEKSGIKFAKLEDAEKVLLRLVSDSSIHAKSIGLDVNGPFDWRDDFDGGFGAEALVREIEKGSYPIPPVLKAM